MERVGENATLRSARQICWLLASFQFYDAATDGKTSFKEALVSISAHAKSKMCVPYECITEMLKRKAKSQGAADDEEACPIHHLLRSTQPSALLAHPAALL